ncbi:MAG: hypothetical protein ACMXYC_02625 [Candidatus Woesearchaeota archaeon]
MVTSIQLSEQTKHILDNLKKNKKTTYEQVILMLLQKQAPKSLAGKFPQLASWKREEDRECT